MMARNSAQTSQRQVVGYQQWSNLTFIHWRVPVSALRPLIPQTLQIETKDGDAWLGIVAFEMGGVRPWWSPALPYISYFPETNLRTYVRLDGYDPGVWFFSLDASRLLAVLAARWGWGLNYYWSRMSVSRRAEQANRERLASDSENPARWSGLHYRSCRRVSGPADSDMEVNIGSGQPHAADVGSLEYFLCERYVLFSQSSRGVLMTARVHHQPYPLLPATLTGISQTLTTKINCPLQRTPDHVVFSPGVTVQVSPLQPAQ